MHCITIATCSAKGQDEQLSADRSKHKSPEKGATAAMEAYCVKCKAKREVKNPTSITMKNGKPATSGTCATCGTKVFKIGNAK